LQAAAAGLQFGVAAGLQQFVGGIDLRLPFLL
jgi:hypothetical protein